MLLKPIKSSECSRASKGPKGVAHLKLKLDKKYYAPEIGEKDSGGIVT